jgi:hypothetical protein
MTSVRETTVQDSTHLDAVLRGLVQPEAPAILLSAGVPDRRDPVEGMTADEQAELARVNQIYMATAQPQRIKLAVTELTRSALMRGMRLIFGAQRDISPWVLEAALQAGAGADSILIFQSEFFRNQIPNSTLELADWSAGRLIFTPLKPGRRRLDEQAASLEEMRKLMVRSPALRGAVFVGGMEGIEREAEIVLRDRPGLPCYALANTGSAARELYGRAPGRFAGNLQQQDRWLLEDYRASFGLAARRILDDLGIPSHQQAP